MNLPPQKSRMGRGRGAGSHLHCHFNFPANASNGPTLPPPTTVWSIGFTIHYPLTSLGAVFLKRNYKFKPVWISKQQSKKLIFFLAEGPVVFSAPVGKNLCKGRDVELNRRAPRLKRASFSTLTTVSPCSHCTMLVVVKLPPKLSKKLSLKLCLKFVHKLSQKLTLELSWNCPWNHH